MAARNQVMSTLNRCSHRANPPLRTAELEGALMDQASLAGIVMIKLIHRVGLMCRRSQSRPPAGPPGWPWARSCSRPCLAHLRGLLQGGEPGPTLSVELAGEKCKIERQERSSEGSVGLQRSGSQAQAEAKPGRPRACLLASGGPSGLCKTVPCSVMPGSKTDPNPAIAGKPGKQCLLPFQRTEVLCLF